MYTIEIAHFSSWPGGCTLNRGTGSSVSSFKGNSTMTTFRLPLVLGALTVSTLVAGGTAEAGRFHAGGHASVHWGGSVGVHFRSPSVNVGVSYARPAYRPRSWGYGYSGGWGVRGHVYYGPSWTYRPWFYYGYYDTAYVPSYYGTSYYPVEAQPQPQYGGPSATAIVAPAPRPELPRFGLGLFAGGASMQDSTAAASSDVGILGRFRLTDGLIVEGELGKDSYEQNLRVDRKLGASLIYEFGAYNRLAPYVVGGLGVQETQTNGTYNANQSYGEVGGGLRLAITPHFHLTGDVRFGARDTTSSDTTTSLGGASSTARAVAPPAADSTATENYTRARLAAVLYF